jgi:actin related protein 2/3 complex subunit 3
VLIYGILFVQEILTKIKPSKRFALTNYLKMSYPHTDTCQTDMSRRDAEKAVNNIALDTNFAIPGDAGFPLNQAFEAPKERNEAETLRQYIMQMRQELAARLLARVYADEATPSKVSSIPISRRYEFTNVW